ncbi:response regulator transcription factor [Actinokineospora enzanensis]|uniref:response regulator transcription factor n=1 Tax=Actinokineospora enzanensis TaxID=155975 RepID=UPI00036EB4F1|nr:response regulator transcription factor [Actinokineospora enzanensis]
MRDTCEVGDRRLQRMAQCLRGFQIGPRHGPDPTTLVGPRLPSGPGRVVVVGNAVLFRDGLAQLIADEEDLRVVAAVDESEDVARSLPLSAPDVVVYHPEPDDPGTRLRTLSDALPGVGFVLLTPPSPAYPVPLPRTGATVLRVSVQVSGARFVAAVRDAWTRSCGASRVGATAEDELSPRETEVLDLVAAAYTNGQIARLLRISENTVKRHLRSVFRKLHAVSRIDAVNRATARSPKGAADVGSRTPS